MPAFSSFTEHGRDQGHALRLLLSDKQEDVGPCGQISESIFLFLVECLKGHRGKATLLPSLAAAPNRGYAAHSYKMMMAPTKKCPRGESS